MRSLVTIHAIGGLALAAMVVWYMSPTEQSVWGPTFFGVPYNMAQVAVPLVAAFCAGYASWRVYRSNTASRSPIVIRSIVIACFAHIMYSIAHTFAYVAFGMLHTGTLVEPIVMGVAFGFAMLTFGALLIVLPGTVISLLCNVVIPKIAP